MGSNFSNTLISEVALDAVTHVISWLHSVADVVDKCFDSLPRGPAGSGHGGIAEAELTADSVSSVNSQSVGEKVRNSLKVVEMGSIGDSGVGSRAIRDHGEGRGGDRDRDRVWNDGGGAHVCAVCLGEVTEEERVYELPQCDHIFHSACLDRWVGLNHSTCPLCRTSLIAGSSSSTAAVAAAGGGAAMVQEEEEGSVGGEGQGFFLGIWFIPRWSMSVNFHSLGWAHAVTSWLAGF